MKYCLFEGLDYSGKTTLIKNLSDRLSEINLNNECIKDPGTTKLGELNRSILIESSELSKYSKLLLFLAGSYQLIYEKVLPRFEDNVVILQDRGFPSSYVYQVGDNKHFESIWINVMSNLFIRPDIIFYLDLNLEERTKRSISRNNKPNVLDKFSLENDLELKTNYLYAIEKYASKNKIIILDGTLTQEQLVDVCLDKIL